MTESTEARQRIWQVIAAIPAGYVASYGQVARQAGLARGARQVGYALRQLPEGTAIPWYRVINSQGRISLPAGSAGHKIQRESLEAEGVVFSERGRVDLRTFGWVP